MSERIKVHECDHDPVGRIAAGDPKTGPHVSAYVCDDDECRRVMMAWVVFLTGLAPDFVPLPVNAPARGGES